MPLGTLLDDFQVYLLMTIRVLVMLSFTPLISDRSTSFLLRITLAAFIAYIVRNIMGIPLYDAPKTLGMFVILLSGEALIGAIVGFYIQIVYQILNGLSEFFSTFMGLRAVQVLNPFSGVTTAVITQFISLIVMFVLVSSYTLQKFLYYGIVQSFLTLNTQLVFSVPREDLLSFIFTGVAGLFERAFVISFPIFISLLLVNIGLGLLGKVAPQINLLVLGLPLQLGLGLVFLFFFLPAMVKGIEVSFDKSIEMISSFVRGVAR